MNTSSEGESLVEHSNSTLSSTATLSNLPKQALEHIFSSFGPRDTALAACVCRSWRDTATLAPWAAFYAACWRSSALAPPRNAATANCFWQSAFTARMSLARGLRGKPEHGRLLDHRSGVKVSKIIPDAHLLLTGSVDRRLVLWDLAHGTKIASSLLHAGTVRCIAIDDELLATGSSDHRIRVWRRQGLDAMYAHSNLEDSTTDVATTTTTRNNIHAGEGQHDGEQERTDGVADPGLTDTSTFPFRIDGERAVLAGGHSGPVSALELSPTSLFSGSWDYSVRVWDRSGLAPTTDEEEEDGVDDESTGTGTVGGMFMNNNGARESASLSSRSDTLGASGWRRRRRRSATWPPLRCVQALHFDDWVTALCLRNDRLLVASGAETHVVDTAGGGGLRHVCSLKRHATNAAITGVQGTEDGRFLFYSTSDGGLVATDLRGPPASEGHGQQQQPSTSFACSSAITGLSWDHPWLAASLQNGEVLLLNADSVLGGYSAAGTAGARVDSDGPGRKPRNPQWSSRALASGISGGAQCVDIQGPWVTAGFESGVVATWDFSKAQQAQQELEALRRAKRAARQIRRERGGGGGDGGRRGRRLRQSARGPGVQWDLPACEQNCHPPEEDEDEDEDSNRFLFSSQNEGTDTNDDDGDCTIRDDLCFGKQRAAGGPLRRTTSPYSTVPAPISLASRSCDDDGDEGGRRQSWHVLGVGQYGSRGELSDGGYLDK